MSNPSLGPGPHTKIRRLPAKADYNEDVIYAILDEARFCHVAGTVDGLAMALPTLHAREGRTLYLHGNKSNAILNAVLDAGRACVSVTLYDGLRLARSGFESSIAYRSVVVVGPTRPIEEEVEKARVLNLFVDAVLSGRASEVRAMSEQEARLTLVVALAIDEASAKVSRGPTEDFVEDMDLPIWSGTVPARLSFGEPVPSRDGAMASGDVPLPESVRRLLEQQ
jgi:nitroimidazol reductase NimA-like FMN-containing flavoprotein (pyridoxamine 5'-phosphate oxidase superfamily)